MNKHKNTTKGFNFLEMTILCFSVAIVLSAGFLHAWLKNSQVEVGREMDRTQRRIQDHEDVINSLQVKIDKKLNIYQLRDDLEKSNSQLVLLPAQVIENVPNETTDVRSGAIAASANADSPFVQNSP
ncbi:hypothetical protein HW115_11795 [Verrucomicrobiaceae bacterium N1E253]|uniref:Uncharacterized protein n=1 Tax=Oceaniferula marina TaxID=2748318 RepID=A0A851GFX9_9BACT|nr:hypothetical protein [Oceaniferula marina]NWK56296.1 hypothetical protein [Oceaniferula marina]